MVISNLMGLVCDFVVGLVELLCVKWNVIGVGNVLIVVDMVLVGCMNKILVDEVIVVMDKVGKGLLKVFWEIGLGGLVVMLIGIWMKEKIFG